MIRYNNVCKKYGENVIYDNLNLEIEEGKITCVLGESGAGKTTLLNMLAGLTDYKGNIENIPSKISYIFQQEKLLNNLTVKQNLQFVLNDKEFFNIDKYLEKVELLDKKNRYPDELSGGERKRVEIARAFVYDSPVLLMDEPFSSLDTALKIRLVNNFVSLWKENKKTTIFVTHDVEMAIMLSQRIIVLEKGEIIFDIDIDDPFPRKYGALPHIKEQILNKILQTM